MVEVAEVQPEVRYLLAVDDSKSTLTDLVQNLSNKLGSGKVKKISKEDALLIKDLPQTNYDLLLVNLRMDAQHVKDMSFEWKSEAGPVENMGSVIKEYKDARGLQPLKIFIQGPPASGKSTVAKKLAEFYQVPLIEVEDVIKKTISRLVSEQCPSARFKGLLRRSPLPQNLLLKARSRTRPLWQPKPPSKQTSNCWTRFVRRQSKTTGGTLKSKCKTLYGTCSKVGSVATRGTFWTVIQSVRKRPRNCSVVRYHKKSH